MVEGPGFHNRGPYIALKIHSLLISLTKEPSEYDKITPKIEFWIENVLREEFTTVDELVEGVSLAAWDEGASYAGVGRFLREFRDAPHRSGQAGSFVDKLCEYVLRWFAITSVENCFLSWNPGSVTMRGGNGFIRVASFIGHLISSGLLDHDLVRWHLVKPLIAHHYTNGNDDGGAVRANAIYELFVTAGNTLLRGLFEPEDVQVCFGILNAQIPLRGIQGLDAGKSQVRCVTHSDRLHRNLTFFGQEFRGIHTTWLEQKRKEEQRNVTKIREREEEEEVDVMTAEVPAEVETPVAFTPQDLPTTGIDTPFEPFFDIPATADSSPTLTISTVSDLTPTELGQDIEHSEEQTTTRHDTLYFEDGNVEIVCEFSVFASLLRMTTKYGFFDVRDQLLKGLKGAHPTKWAAY